MKNLYLPHHVNVKLAILCVCAGYFLFSYGDMLIKLLSQHYHFSEIMFFNGLFSLICTGSYGLATKGTKAFKTKKLPLHLVRAGLSVLIGTANIFAWPHITMPEFYVLVFTSPFWLALISVVALKDKITLGRFIAILVGFSAVLIMFRTGMGLTFTPYSLAILGGAFLYSIMLIIIRRMGPDESKVVLVMTGASTSIAYSLIFLPAHFIMPSLSHLFMFFLCGSSGAIGLGFISAAMQYTPSSSLIAPFHYTQLIYGIMFGYFIFNDIPGIHMLMGASIIVMTGIYLIHSETRKKKIPLETHV